jgi:hypothetical protein
MLGLRVVVGAVRVGTAPGWGAGGEEVVEEGIVGVGPGWGAGG